MFAASLIFAALAHQFGADNHWLLTSFERGIGVPAMPELNVPLDSVTTGDIKIIDTLANKDSAFQFASTVPDTTMVQTAAIREAVTMMAGPPCDVINCATTGMPFTVAGSPTSIIYVSSSTSGSSSGGTGISFADEDILKYENSVWTKHFDGSDVGLQGGPDVDGFHLLPNGDILMTFDREVTLSGIVFDDSDVALFAPTSLGNVTAGAFTMYFDGSTKGLETTGEDIDAISLRGNGELIFSTLGTTIIPRTGYDTLRQQDEDLTRRRNSDNLLTRYLDGSDLGLNTTQYEDVWGLHIDSSSGDIYLTTKGDYDASGISGNSNDIFVCGTPRTTGSNTSCPLSLFWDGDAHGLSNEVVDGFSITDGIVIAASIFSSVPSDADTEDDFMDTDADDFEDDSGNEVNHPDTLDDALFEDDIKPQTSLYLPIMQ